MSTESRIEARAAKAAGGVVAEGRKHDAAAEALSQAASTFIDLTRHFHQQWEGMGRIMDEGTVSAEAHALRETCSRLYRLSKSGLDALTAAQAREVGLREALSAADVREARLRTVLDGATQTDPFQEDDRAVCRAFITMCRDYRAALALSAPTPRPPTMTDTGETMGLREAVARIVDPRPQVWRTADEWGKRTGVSEGSAKRIWLTYSEERAQALGRADLVLAFPQLAGREPEADAAACDEITGADIWELLFGIMRGGVPDEITEEVCDQLAADLGTTFLATPLAAQQARIAELEGALEPFAKVAEHYGGHDDADLVVVDLGQCRTARAALRKDPQQ